MFRPKRFCHVVSVTWTTQHPMWHLTRHHVTHSFGHPFLRIASRSTRTIGRFLALAREFGHRRWFWDATASYIPIPFFLAFWMRPSSQRFVVAYTGQIDADEVTIVTNYQNVMYTLRIEISSCWKILCISKWISCLSMCKEATCGLEISSTTIVAVGMYCLACIETTKFLEN